MAVSIICETCGKETLKPASSITRVKHHFCSHDCYWLWKKGKRISIGTEYKKGHIPWITGLKGVFAGEKCYWFGKKHTEESKKKMSINMKGKRIGENCWNWKGGVTPENKKFRTTNDWRKWREEVFKRDNYTCRKCGAKSVRDEYVKLEPHHIFRVIDLIKNNMRKHIFNLDNGVTLCYTCHRRVSALSNRRRVATFQ